MTRERIRAGYLARQFVATLRPEEGARGAWERKRKDEKTQAEPEPSFNDPPYSSYPQNSYGQNQQQQQQQQYSGPQYQAPQPPYHDPNSYNAPNNTAGYGGQPPNNGGYAPYSGQPSPPLASQDQYGNHQNPQTQNPPVGSFYGQNAPGNYMPGQNTHSVPQGQPPFAPPQGQNTHSVPQGQLPFPPLQRAATTGSSMHTAPPAFRWCTIHGYDRDHSCYECRALPY